MTTRRKILVVGVLGMVTIVAAGCIVLLARRGPVPQGQPTSAPEGEEWTTLLDAAHESGWENITDDGDIFEIRDGLLHIFGDSFLTLRYVGYVAEEFSDFDLHLEFKLESGANSGVFLRAQRNDPVYRGFEIQVLDDHGKRPTKNRSGAIYDVVTPMFNMSRPAGEWNSIDVTVLGTDVSVVMNGWKVIDVDLSKMTEPLGKFDVPYAELPQEGLITLQDHGGEVWYRNIVVRKR